MPENLQAILLAGGKSMRFNTEKTKLTEKICGKEMILYPIELLQRMNIPTTIVVGFQKEKILDLITDNNIKNISVAVQEEQFGTGHAVAVSKKFWNKDHILIINGDIPLMTSEVIQKLYNKHIKTDADISFATAHSLDEANDSYCRIVINDNKIRVVERRDEKLDMDAQCCVSVGIYIMKKSFLENHIDKLSKSSLTNEFYLPELIQIASDEQCKIVTTPTSFDLARAVNTIAELWAVEHIKRSQIISFWMNHGVRFASSLNVIIDCDVILQPGVFIGLGVHLLGKTVVKRNTEILAFAYIKDSIIEQNVKIKPHTVITKSTIEEDAVINSFTQVNYQHVANTPQKITKKDSPLFMGAIKDETEINGTSNL
ncbi:NTP transferase domain-containing protein [Candidatus Babeliales bacterium]|nr:NTP transferase domain-containing protein [Candidatus Babeliales bacterium]MBP9843311.1 NTP transferase domain-containing protein [Candidatus Babeliales bacterium]